MATIISNLMLELKARNILTDHLNSLRLLCELSSRPFCASNEECWIELLTKVSNTCLISITAHLSCVSSVLFAGDTSHPSWTLTEKNETISLNQAVNIDIMSSILDDLVDDFTPLRNQEKPNDNEFSPISDDEEDDDSNTAHTSEVSKCPMQDNSESSKPTKHHREHGKEILEPRKRKQTRPKQHREHGKEISEPTKRKQTRSKLSSNQKRSKADDDDDFIEKIMASDNESGSGVAEEEDPSS